jgi:hypothetical protein
MSQRGVPKLAFNLLDSFGDSSGQPPGAKQLRDVVESMTVRTFNTQAANYTVLLTDWLVRVDASGGARTITLPAASSCPGQTFCIKKVDSSGNAVTVSRAGSDTIDGQSTVSLATQYAKVLLLSNGAGWDVIG